MVESKVSLVNCLSYCEGLSEHPYFFINSSDALGTFFTYKGTLLEIGKVKILIDMGKSKKADEADKIRRALINCAKMGDWLVFHIGANSAFKVTEFLSDLLAIDAKLLLKHENYLSRDFYVNQKILHTNEDFDNFQNKGCWKPNNGFRIHFLTSCASEDVGELKLNNSESLYKFVVVE